MDNQPIKRKQIALMFLLTYKNWAGGLIYIINIVSALNLLDDESKPEILIVHGPQSPIEDLKATGYPYLKFKQVNTSPSLLERVFNKAYRTLFRKSTYYGFLPEVTYPYDTSICLGKRQIFWIPDFQDRYLPEMFTQDDLQRKNRGRELIAASAGVVVFSSENSMNDFKKFYPDHNCTLKLLRFACILPPYNHVDIEAVKQKHNIDGPFFMSPNQFWKHKNHKVVLEAARILKTKGISFCIVFSGNENDHRNREYFQTLRDYIDEHQLESHIRFLGFIERSEQLALMNSAISIIQPSFFEGWSTVVEDAKALNQHIILSNLDVHQEQINVNCEFFDPKNAGELAFHMESLTENPPIRVPFDYNADIKRFSQAILKVLEV